MTYLFHFIKKFHIIIIFIIISFIKLYYLIKKKYFYILKWDNVNKLGFFEEIKINEMSYNDTIKSLKGTFQCQFDVKKFEDILDNFKKFNDDKKITRFPLKTLKELLKEKKKIIILI